MRHTKLTRTTAVTIAVILIAVAAIAFLRTRPGSGEAAHAASGGDPAEQTAVQPRGDQATAPPGDSAEPAAVEEGGRLFREKGCAQCHRTDSTEVKIGPGLANILQREKLPTSNRPATRPNVRQQIVDPYDKMPSYADRLTDDQLRKLVDYLQTL